MSEQAVYLYAVARGLRAEDLAGVPGPAGSGVRIIEHAGLSAVVGDVPLDEFGEEPLKTNLERLDWLEETARTHHDVVSAAASAAPTAPVSLVTVYRDDDRVRAMLDLRRDALTAALERISGRREWGLKVYAEPRREPEERAPADDGKPGTSYLMRRRAQQRSREELARRQAEQAETVHRELAKTAVATRRHPPQDPRLSGRAGQMLLNMAYLVDEAEADGFVRRVEDAAARAEGLRIEATGPWPAYSFIDLEEPDEPDEEVTGEREHR
ncbi:GvpL/GvpF family gas vesicle protein [Thermomonospora umbrina]|uniref:Gas vesicle protein GvpL/GvpF n=1 Tax=Thermomonospora umbrina TaxID=111806 RepID=A0A3D9ST89_9ACTN|nr:GvpL/GvpF family gas vesicle protein [Thermomonospora umbrina]REE95784.1 gas vesicle protein GvpL/GvpF [Thermomonospora umbrina]